MAEFRRLALVSILSGTIAGLVWFTIQYFAVVPLIRKAEVFELPSHENQAEEAGWRPENGGERNAFTAAATVLAAIGLSAVLFGIVQALGRTLDARRGLLWGLAGFLCLNAAPALGLPPRPPGVIQADLATRQFWWAATVGLTAIGLWLIAGWRTAGWFHKLAGLAAIALPHLGGAPSATGRNLVPPQLMTSFAAASLFAAAMFWMTLGFSGGFFLNTLVNTQTPAPAENRSNGV